MGKLDQRKRNSNKRKTKSIVVIGCEGKNKTETTYFNNYLSRECIIKFSTGIHTNPEGMANDLVDYLKAKDMGANYGDKVYLILDTDVNENKQEQIDRAKEICDKNNIELITSTPSFEFWYILHFGFTTKSYSSSKQIKSELRKKIPGYSEKMNVYPLICEDTEKAIEYAKKIERFHMDNNHAIDSDKANPHTGAYKVVEELKRRNEKSSS